MLFVSVLSSCKKDPIIPNEEELITTLTYTLTPVGGGSAVEFKFLDLDGDGGNAPIITEGVLLANTTYTGSLTLLNETETPADNITLEIAEEALAHQFFYHFSGSDNTITITDVDADGNTLGLKTTFTTTQAGTEQLVITLRHEPTKPNNNNLMTAGGETDIEVTFNVEVELP